MTLFANPPLAAYIREYGIDVHPSEYVPPKELLAYNLDTLFQVGLFANPFSDQILTYEKIEYDKH